MINLFQINIKVINMKNKLLFSNWMYCIIGLILVVFTGCKKRDVGDLQAPSFPNTAEVFIDDFTPDLVYAAFGGSDVKAFQVDNQETYNSSRQSMRFEVPDANSPNGSYAGGVFMSSVGRDLSGYNALTFYIKATQPATIGVMGFGNDFGANRYQVTLNGLPVNSNWKKVIIPIPDASKLTAEKGLFYYSTGPENNNGYTFWIDEVRFEKLGTIGHPTASILNGEDKQQISYVGVNNTIDGLSASFNLPTGINTTLQLSPYYFSFSSSNPAVATVGETGSVTTIGGGATTITATLDTIQASGSLTINSQGNFVHAPTPTQNPADVISIFSDAYTNINVDYYNGYWAPFQTTKSADFEVGGDNVLNYTDLNFVGIQVSSPVVSIASKTNLHIDLFVPGTLNSGASLQIQVLDFGADGAPGGGDDVSGSTTISAPTLVASGWASLDIPLSSFAGLTTKGHFGQIIFVGNNLTNFFADNIYFWSNPITPPGPAPIPTRDAANVLSIFSDSYTNIAGTDFFPNWGQSTVVTQTPIAGNNTLLYTNFNYQGVQLGSNQNVSTYGYMHLDYYSANAGMLRVYLISPGLETPFTLNVPTSGWNSVDIPLSAFAPVDMTNIIQLKFDGGAGSDIYLDNIYFYKLPVTPLVAAPVPTRDAANVLSIFSDAYTNVAGSDFNPNWGQSTVVTQTPIAGNNTLHYANFNYQGLQLGSNQDVSTYGFLHVDYYSTNGSTLRIYLISPGPVETPYTLTVPTTGWNSVDIPLSAFSPVALNNVFQFKFDGGSGSDIFLDNIYFWKDPGGGGGGSCPTPPVGEFIVDGGFEANAGCWELIAIQAGTSSTIVSNVSNGGTNSARIKTAQAGNPGIKQTRFGVGSILPNTTYRVQFDIRSDASDPLVNGAILNVATFSEAANGSGLPAVRHDLIAGEANVPSTWATRTITFTTAANVEGGLSFLIELIGGGATTSGTIFIDNVSLIRQ